MPAHVLGAVPAIGSADVSAPVRHSAIVRITHWIHTAAFGGLVISGIAILVSHPRLYWGETGGVGAPSLIDLPLPFFNTGQTGWGRSLHFLSAWVYIANGLLYIVHGLSSGHMGELLPARTDLRRKALWRVMSNHLQLKIGTEHQPAAYNVLQRVSYLTVVFVLAPLMIWTGLAMSPAVTSVLPILVETMGGQQSARTIHFVVANLLLAFLVVHVAMVCLAGFTSHVRAMLTGARP